LLLVRVAIVVRSVLASLLKRGGVLNDVFPAAANQLCPDNVVYIVQLQEDVLEELVNTKYTLNG
jgi:hypothetical protein